MNKKLALLAAAGSLALVASAQTGAMAQDSGYYGAIGAGIALGNDETDFENRDGADVVPSAFTSNLELDDNITIYGAIGKYFQGGVRGELELATRTQDVDSIDGDGLGFGGFPVSDEVALGDFTVTTLMVNVFKDFNVDAAGRLTPYLGAGIGAAKVRAEFDNIAFADVLDSGDSPAAGYAVFTQSDDYTIALQGMAGLTFDFTDNMMIDVRYKYLGTGKAEYDSVINARDVAVESNYRVQEITAGLRWNFGGQPAAEPAPYVPPAPELKTCFDGTRVPVTEECPPEIVEQVEAPDELELTVYFDYDSAALTDAAQSLIQARAAEAREYDITSITVQGNTDTSGSSAYNERLSARRANVVRDALVANGIPASAISLEALGESNPAKPTADGVREPLNRRTEVSFDF